MAPDPAVAKTAYKTAADLKASPKVMLALFEAGLVESGMENLDHGPDGSKGFLQQRPDQGWPDVMNVATATRSFVTRAKALEGKYASAGQVAQAVQRSAFPDRYDKQADRAASLLRQTRGPVEPAGGLADPLDAFLKSIGIAGGDAGAGAAAAGTLTGAVQSAADGLRGIAAGATSVGKLAELGMKLALPTNLTRAVVGGLGIVLVFIGIAQLGREVKG